ncbi:hypothetical protein DB31_1017 [Hyalangium minutum]|uniref:Uncharacterized protein n=1 Tax=Hyalangium minutum TaxID=394096 RepID=A0A085WFT1_9BACT|nr:hypothetical protein DB31_1017 [Hyalangium minutum]
MKFRWMEHDINEGIYRVALDSIKLFLAAPLKPVYEECAVLWRSFESEGSQWRGQIRQDVDEFFA